MSIPGYGWWRRTSLCMLVLLAACAASSAQASKPAASGPASASQPASRPAGALGQYFGFGEMEILKLQWGTGLPIAVDINRDGLNDLIVVNNRKSRIELLLQKPHFQPEQAVVPAADEDDINDLTGKEANWRFKRVSFDLDVEATSLVVADLNHDGLPDLAYNSRAGLYVVCQGKGGAATQSAPADGAAPRAPQWLPARKIDIREGLPVDRALAAGDVNGDGMTDLALLTGEGVILVLQKPDGALDKPAKFYTSGKSPRQVDLADLDGDGRDDLIVTTGEGEYPLWVRFQGPSGKLGPEVRLRLPAPAVLEPVALRTQRRRYLAEVASLSGRLALWTVQADPQHSSYPVYSYPLPATDGAEKRDMVAADLDGDGRLDVVVSDPARAEFLLLRATEKGSLASAEPFPGLMDMQKLCAGDLDGLGRSAIVALSVQEKLIGVSRLDSGRLSYPASVEIKGEPVAMDLADVTGDGRLDLVYVGKEKDKYSLRVITALGQKDAAAGAELALTDLKDKPLDLRLADVDHDGRPDAVIVRPYGPLLLVRQAEAGRFEQVADTDIHAGLVAGLNPASISAAPLGTKGAPALLAAQRQFARAMVFQAGKGWEVVDQYPAPSPLSNLTAAAAFAMPGATAMTIVIYDAAREKLGLLARQDDGTYQAANEVEVGAVTARKILAGNFGGPSPVSLLLCGSGTLIRVPLSEQTIQPVKVAGFETDLKDSRYGALAVGDLNGDRLPDIALCDQAGGAVEILAFDPAGRLVPALRFKVYEQPRSIERTVYREGRGKESGEPRAVLIADVTGDGKADLILAVHDRLIIYPQD